MEKISVIIPCYNVEKYIGKCLESIMNQTWTNLEIICIDDGSTDNTLQVLLHLADIDSRIMVLTQENRGVSHARNVALKKCTGEFFMFVDSDDWLDLHTITILLNEYNGEDIILFSYTREFNFGSTPKILPVDGVLNAKLLQRMILGPINHEKLYLHSIDAFSSACCKIYKKVILTDNIHFKHLEKIGTWEDGFFNFEILNNCKEVRIVNNPLYHYRKSNENSITTQYKNKLPSQWIYKFSLLQNFLLKNEKDDKYVTALNNRICITFFNLCLNEINSGAGFWKIKSRINNILDQNLYSQSFKQFDLAFVPLHWKIFFLFAKVRFDFGITCISIIIHFIINRKN